MLIRRSVVQTLAAPVCQSTSREDAEPQVIPDVSIGASVRQKALQHRKKVLVCM